MGNSNNNQEQGDINIYCVIGEKENRKPYNGEILKFIEKIKEFEKISLEGNLEVK